MNATTNQSVSHAASNTKPTINRLGRGGLGGMIILIGLVGTIFACAAHPTTNAAPATAESLFADALRPEPIRLKSAREAVKRGEGELAIHDYLASIQEDPTTAELAIGEMGEVFLSAARAHNRDGRYVDESAQTNRCYQTLHQLSQADAGPNALPESARVKLFHEIAAVRGVGNGAAKDDITAADQLRCQAKGKHWWNRNDHNKQAEALHKINLAWSYYPAFTDEWMVNKMYEIWADMKGQLPSWQYNQVMERDRLQLGRAVGDR